MINLVAELDGYFSSRFGRNSLSKLFHRFSPKENELLEMLRKAGFSEADESLQAYRQANGQHAYEKSMQRLHARYAAIFADKLLDASDESFDSNRNRAIECARMVNMLTATACGLNIDHYTRQGVKYAKKSGQTEFELQLNWRKLNSLGNRKQDAVGFYHTLNEVRRLERLHHIESNLQLDYWETYALTKKRLKQIDVSVERIDALKEQLDENISLRSNLILYNHIMLLLEIKGDYRLMLEVANDGIAFLHRHDLKSRAIEENFLRRKYLSSLHLKKYEDIKSTIQTYFKFIPKFSANWYVLSAYTSILFIHTGDHVNALEYTSQTQSNTLGVPKNVIQFYKLVQGYAKLLNNIREKESKSFRIFKLVNELPEHSRDKQGINIAILNLQVLYFVWKKRYDDIIERADALNQYAYRHLRKGKNFRSNCFIKMIVQMTRAEFHPIRTERYTAELLQKLKSQPLELAEQPFDVEIIPYEQFWELIMSLLEKNRR